MVGRLVAADAGDVFAGHGRVAAPHDLHGRAVGIDGLEGERRARRHAEERRAVVLDGHGSDDAHGIPRTPAADQVGAGRVEVAEVEGNQP